METVIEYIFYICFWTSCIFAVCVLPGGKYVFKLVNYILDKIIKLDNLLFLNRKESING